MSNFFIKVGGSFIKPARFFIKLTKYGSGPVEKDSTGPLFDGLLFGFGWSAVGVVGLGGLHIDALDCAAVPFYSV